MLKVYLNAQAKEYNHSPSDTFWETQGVIEMLPLGCRFTPRSGHFKYLLVKLQHWCLMHPPHPSFFSAARVIKELILPAQYEDVVGDDLINLAVVLEDMASQERVLASEEFNIPSSQLTIQVNTLVNMTLSGVLSFHYPKACFLEECSKHILSTDCLYL